MASAAKSIQANPIGVEAGPVPMPGIADMFAAMIAGAGKDGDEKGGEDAAPELKLEEVSFEADAGEDAAVLLPMLDQQRAVTPAVKLVAPPVETAAPAQAIIAPVPAVITQPTITTDAAPVVRSGPSKGKPAPVQDIPAVAAAQPVVTNAVQPEAAAPASEVAPAITPSRPVAATQGATVAPPVDTPRIPEIDTAKSASPVRAADPETGPRVGNAQTIPAATEAPTAKPVTRQAAAKAPAPVVIDTALDANKSVPPAADPAPAARGVVTEIKPGSIPVEKTASPVVTNVGQVPTQKAAPVEPSTGKSSPDAVTFVADETPIARAVVRPAPNGKPASEPRQTVVKEAVAPAAPPVAAQPVAPQPAATEAPEAPAVQAQTSAPPTVAVSEPPKATQQPATLNSVPPRQTGNEAPLAAQPVATATGPAVTPAAETKATSVQQDARGRAAPASAPVASAATQPATPVKAKTPVARAAAEPKADAVNIPIAARDVITPRTREARVAATPMPVDTSSEGSASAPATSGNAPTTAMPPQPVQAAQPFMQPNVAPAQTVASALSQQVLDLSHGDAWIDQIARDISQTSGKDGAMRFRLAPETLGELKVEITHSERGAHVRLAVTSEAAQQALAAAEPKLAAEARAQGVRIAETEISFTGGQSQGREMGRPAQDQAQNQQQSQPGQPQRSARSGQAASFTESAAPSARRNDRYA